MKNLLIICLLLFFPSHSQASCVNWTELYRCENGNSSLHYGESWCSGGANKTAYHLSINSDDAKKHLTQLARIEISFLGLTPTENYGIFKSKINQYISAVITENHQNFSLSVELFLDNKKLGEYIFKNCSF